MERVSLARVSFCRLARAWRRACAYRRDADVCSVPEQCRDALRSASSNRDHDEALKVFLQNLLDSMLIAFMWGISRSVWSVRVD
jgi:hypothetical protein